MTVTRDARGRIQSCSRTDGWAIGFDACIDCKRTDRRHRARGRCTTCHQAYRMATDAAYYASQRATNRAYSMYRYDSKREQ